MEIYLAILAASRGLPTICSNIYVQGFMDELHMLLVHTHLVHLILYLH
jgi:hypothetical protein